MICTYAGTQLRPIILICSYQKMRFQYLKHVGPRLSTRKKLFSSTALSLIDILNNGQRRLQRLQAFNVIQLQTNV
jgi:hypothetical protein